MELYKKHTTQSQNKKNKKGHKFFGKQQKAILTFTRARFWSWNQNLRKLKHQSWPIGIQRSLLDQKKKKEDKFSNTLQSNAKYPTCWKETDEVIAVNGKKVGYILSAIIPLDNLYKNLFKFLTKSCFWESLRAGISHWLNFVPELCFLATSKSKIASKYTKEIFIPCLGIYLSLFCFSPFQFPFLFQMTTYRKKKIWKIPHPRLEAIKWSPIWRSRHLHS